MKKLICDRCGIELTDKEDIYAALEGREAWEAAARARGVAPRGILPCKNFVRCSGEINLVANGRVARWWRSLIKLPGR